MKYEMLEKIKKFAKANFCNEKTDFYVDDGEFAVTDPWMDHSGRFELDDEGAVAEWGLDVVSEFIEKARKKIEEEHDPVLCGFVWCYGNKDFSAYEVRLKKEDRDSIEQILAKYETDGTSERNVWDSKFSDVFCEEY